MAKKIVAIKITAAQGGVRLSSMVQSPRGTKVLSGDVVVETAGLTPTERKKAIEKAIKELRA